MLSRRISMFMPELDLTSRVAITEFLSWLFNIRDAMPESSIYDSARVQQRYKPRSSQCRRIILRNCLNIESRFHSQRIYELKKWPLGNGPTLFCLPNCNGIRCGFFEFFPIRPVFVSHVH